jgi:hypothetical protein
MRREPVSSVAACRAGIAVWLIVLGCGGSEDDASSVCMGNPAGFYEIEYTERDGACGPLASMLVDMSSFHWTKGSITPGCTGTTQISTDACTRQVTITCLADRTPRFELLCEMISTLDTCASAPTITLRGSVEWSPDYEDAQGTMALATSGTGADCSGLWDVQLLRQ